MLMVLLTALGGLNTSTPAALASPLTQSFLIGFNEEASHFAFVTYQTSDVEQTGSAVLYVLELAGDRYVGDTPRGYGGMQLDAAGDIISNTEDGVAALRAALTEPRSPLTRFGIELGNYRPLYPHAPGEVAAEAPAKAQALIVDVPGRASGDVVLEIDSFDLPGAGLGDGLSCRDILGNAEARGYALTLRRDQGAVRQVHRDRSLPRSRRCPAHYGIAALVLPFDRPGATSANAVAVIRYSFPGFEGPGMGYLALPVPLE
jgi:predicted secreted protein